MKTWFIRLKGKDCSRASLQSIFTLMLLWELKWWGVKRMCETPLGTSFALRAVLVAIFWIGFSGPLAVCGRYSVLMK